MQPADHEAPAAVVLLPAAPCALRLGAADAGVVKGALVGLASDRVLPKARAARAQPARQCFAAPVVHRAALVECRAVGQLYWTAFPHFDDVPGLVRRKALLLGDHPVDQGLVGLVRGDGTLRRHTLGHDRRLRVRGNDAAEEPARLLLPELEAVTLHVLRVPVGGRRVYPGHHRGAEAPLGRDVDRGREGRADQCREVGGRWSGLRDLVGLALEPLELPKLARGVVARRCCESAGHLGGALLKRATQAAEAVDAVHGGRDGDVADAPDLRGDVAVHAGQCLPSGVGAVVRTVLAGHGGVRIDVRVQHPARCYVDQDELVVALPDEHPALCRVLREPARHHSSVLVRTLVRFRAEESP
mmetsp:Transcript_73948/g.216598  ORF Transcript_73948/g.216598 Transcript_73948/m.216598 type:complete len:357 (-) Transcript_73948:1067-2137(-)